MIPVEVLKQTAKQMFYRTVAVSTFGLSVFVGGMIYQHGEEKENRKLMTEKGLVIPTITRVDVVTKTSRSVEEDTMADERIIRIAPKLGGVLKGMGNEIVQAANRYDIDAYLLYAIIRHESANGTSPMVRNQNNPGGLYDSRKGVFVTYPSLLRGIGATAYEIDALKKKGVTTIEEIGPIWCPLDDPKDKTGMNKHWVPKVREYYQEVKK